MKNPRLLLSLIALAPVLASGADKPMVDEAEIPAGVVYAGTDPKIIETAHKVGLKAELETWPPMVLGTSAMTLFDITTAYGTFATGGVVLTPYSVLEIRRPNGDVLYSRSKDPKVLAFLEELLK